MNRAYDSFITERKIIGEGAMSKVYYWNDYAYKCYNNDYSQTLIDYEYEIQKKICKSKLNVSKYYKTNFPRTVKMSFINGKTTSSMFNVYGKEKVLDDFISYFEEVHKVKDLKLDQLADFLCKQIDTAPATKVQKKLAKKYIEEIENSVDEEDVLCHMDYHFLNTMYVNDDIYVVDWIDARNGKAIYDYARTYVMIYEYVAGFKYRYLKKIMLLKNYDKDIFKKAIYVNAINRIEEHDSKRIRQLIELIETDKWS